MLASISDFGEKGLLGSCNFSLRSLHIQYGLAERSKFGHRRIIVEITHALGWSIFVIGVVDLVGRGLKETPRETPVAAEACVESPHIWSDVRLDLSVFWLKIWPYVPVSGPITN